MKYVQKVKLPLKAAITKLVPMNKFLNSIRVLEFYLSKNNVGVENTIMESNMICPLIFRCHKLGIT